MPGSSLGLPLGFLVAFSGLPVYLLGSSSSQLDNFEQLTTNAGKSEGLGLPVLSSPRPKA